jgi:hypothetical protein
MQKNRRLRRGYRIVSNSMFPCLCSSLHVPVPCVVRCLSFCFAVLWLVALRGVVAAFLDAVLARLFSVRLLAVYVRCGVTSLTDAVWFNPVTLGAARWIVLRGDPSFACTPLSQLASSQQPAVSGKAPSSAHQSVGSAQVDRLK